MIALLRVERLRRAAGFGVEHQQAAAQVNGQLFDRRHQVLPIAFAPTTRMHQQFLNFSTMHAIGFRAQRHLYRADNHTVFGKHQEMFFTMGNFSSHPLPVPMQLGITDRQYKPYRRTVVDGIAQLGALQIWKRSLTDPDGALAGYKRALRLGGTLPLPELYAAAGARLIFDADGMRELVELVEERLEMLRGSTVS